MRLKITLAYSGGAYAGWQRQLRKPTVQGRLERALAEVDGGEVTAMGASRTDAGVHASGQVAHADVRRRLEAGDWLAALNANLPADVRVGRVEPVGDDFHARYGAIRKVYRYHVDESAVASPFLAPYAWHRPGSLDLEAMQAAATALEGGVDQRTFATRPDGVERPRPLEMVRVERGRLLAVTVVGRSFLRYAVRGLVGTLVDVGAGRRDPATVHDLARSGDRAAAGATAPAHGLCLVRVDHEPHPPDGSARGTGRG